MQYDSRLDIQFEQHGIYDICSIRPCYYGSMCGRDLNNTFFAKPVNVYVFHHICTAFCRKNIMTCYRNENKPNYGLVYRCIYVSLNLYELPRMGFNMELS